MLDIILTAPLVVIEDCQENYFYDFMIMLVCWCKLLAGFNYVRICHVCDVSQSIVNQ